MSEKDDVFLKKLLLAFKDEAHAHLQAISVGLMSIEKDIPESEKMATIETIYREAHTLKGAARVVNLYDIESICQGIENIFSAWKHQETPLSSDKFNLLHSALNLIQLFLTSLETNNVAIDKKQISSMIALLSSAHILSTDIDNVHIPTQVHGALADNIRIATVKLDALLLHAEELQTISLILNQREIDLMELKNTLTLWKKEWEKYASDIFIKKQINVDFSGINDNKPQEYHEKLLSIFDQNRAMINHIEENLVTLSHQIGRDKFSFGLLVDTLLDDAKKILMLPFSTLLDLVPKIVRDLSQDRGKEVVLKIHGEKIEVDKRILEELKETLIHIIRNSIDHGIESSAERIQNNKPAQGNVTIQLSQTNGNEVEIAIHDDGAGININAVKSSAIKQGILTPENIEKLTDKDIINLIYCSGISTSPILTEISGRGLGMAIVLEKIDKIGGKIFIESIPQQGTTTKIIVPLTLATFKGVLIQVSNQSFVLPIANLEYITRIQSSDIKTIEHQETLSLNGQIISLVNLKDILELPSIEFDDHDRHYFPVLIINIIGKRIAFKVDSVLNEQEILVKNLAKPLLRIRNIAGATVLGSGKAIPILNASDLVQSAIKYNPTKPILSQTVKPNKNKKTILLVEDSVTTRMLLKNILELSGFEVKATVNGAEAFSILKLYPISIVVSDVEMPLVNGFELTKKIRADKKLSDIPVVLVTARESIDDRERGIEAGADAYILKSSFDSTMLLNVINRLI